MKNTLTKIIALSAVFAATASVSFAATITLTNGGLGQVAAQPQQFGVAVCNNGTSAINASVPVSVSANGQNATVSSVAGIAVGKCEYTYLPYSQLGMQAGQTYSVDVTIDPQHTIVSNANNETTYSVTVPGQMAAANNTNLTANASENVSSNVFVNVWNWVVGFFKGL